MFPTCPRIIAINLFAILVRIRLQYRVLVVIIFGCCHCAPIRRYWVRPEPRDTHAEFKTLKIAYSSRSEQNPDSLVLVWENSRYNLAEVVQRGVEFVPNKRTTRAGCSDTGRRREERSVIMGSSPLRSSRRRTPTVRDLAEKFRALVRYYVSARICAQGALLCVEDSTMKSVGAVQVYKAKQ